MAGNGRPQVAESEFLGYFAGLSREALAANLRR
jgi:hypothetical protein